MTRRAIFDELAIRGVRWEGRLDEVSFLERLYDLGELWSEDSRYRTARADIQQHRVRNDDWADDWVLTDRRFELLRGDDEKLLRFLCETVHPVVRSDEEEVRQLVELYNQHLVRDGFQLAPSAYISGRPVYSAQKTLPGPLEAIDAAATLTKVDASYVATQVTRMQAALAQSDSELAIGTAKDLVETICKTSLDVQGVSYSPSIEMPRLVKEALKSLSLTPESIPARAKGAESIKKILGGLSMLAAELVQLRKFYGTGHGKTAGTLGLTSRHARLAVGAASTFAAFVIETLEDRCH